MLNKVEALDAWASCKTVDGNPTITETQTYAALHNYKVKILSIGCDEVVVYYNDQELIVIIGGSSADKDEWLGNITAYKTVNGCHKNYYNAAKQISKEIDKLHLYRNRRLQYRGHSRGGAIAQLIRSEFHSKGTVVSFGAPKPFTKKKAKQQTFTHYCFIAQGDFVPLNPFSWFWPGWKIYSSNLVKFKRLKCLFIKGKL